MHIFILDSANTAPLKDGKQTFQCAAILAKLRHNPIFYQQLQLLPLQVKNMQAKILCVSHLNLSDLFYKSHFCSFLSAIKLMFNCPYFSTFVHNVSLGDGVNNMKNNELLSLFVQKIDFTIRRTISCYQCYISSNF